MFPARPLRRLFFATMLLAACGFGQPFGNWKLNSVRSTFAGDLRPKTLTLRIEGHAKGEVVTMDRTELTGQTTSFSMLLYLDGVAREFQQGQCSGSQASRRIDSRSIEILRNCGADAWTRFRLTAAKNELILDISEQRAGSRRFDRRLIFEKE